jgi:hypothetical protein
MNKPVDFLPVFLLNRMGTLFRNFLELVYDFIIMNNGLVLEDKKIRSRNILKTLNRCRCNTLQV